ncbi:MAG: hypothetical protein ACI4J0_07500 [Huintestinicola sp.]|uniref:hypothetical protein n=1 Tax=Huintestinicola sp. TaxID=2981661 RepID=UPI003F04BCDE
MKKNITSAFVSLAMCLINRRVRTMVGEGVLGFFLRCYFNDIAGSITFMSLANIFLMFLGSQGIVKPLHIEALLLGAGLFWEYGAPLIRSDTVSDPVDILAYLLGGVIYWLVAVRPVHFKKMPVQTYSDFTK